MLSVPPGHKQFRPSLPRPRYANLELAYGKIVCTEVYTDRFVGEWYVYREVVWAIPLSELTLMS